MQTVGKYITNDDCECAVMVDPERETYTNFYTGECGFLQQEQMEEEAGTVATEDAEKIMWINETAQQKFITARNRIADYCEKRHLTKADIKRFGLGYSVNLEGVISREDLLLAGLAKEDEKGFRMMFRNRMMFPIRNTDGRIIAFGGRRMDGEKICKYMNTGETEAFRKRETLYMYQEACKADCRAYILCEGYMDVIAMHKAGFINTVASLGTSLTQEQVRMLETKPNIYIMYDSDEAGIKAAKRAILMFKRHTVKVVTLNKCKDPDEFFAEHTKEDMVECLRAATDAKDFIRKTYQTGDDPELVKYLLI